MDGHIYHYRIFLSDGIEAKFKECWECLTLYPITICDCALENQPQQLYILLGQNVLEYCGYESEKSKFIANSKNIFADQCVHGHFLFCVASHSQGQGGTDCDFYPAAALDGHISLESCMNPGSHVGVLPSGQVTAPGQTTKMTDAAHFKIKYIVSCLIL